MMGGFKDKWNQIEQKKPGITQFILFTLVSIGTALLQFILMPVLKAVFNHTDLVNEGLQIVRLGTNFDGSPYYLFDYAAGSIDSNGGGGVAYFLAVEIAIAVGQVVNFLFQRKVAFKSNSSIVHAALWYLIAYLIITVGCAALQGVYKAGLYNSLINVHGLGKRGETLADLLTMLINSIISYIVFYPILKIIFRKKEDKVEQS